jgi:threonine aldolase
MGIRANPQEGIPVIDLRSDTVTRPTREMRAAMAAAEVGDDGRRNADGRGEDPSVNKLADRAAAMAGMEAATFVSTGTMGNMLSLMTHCKLGESAAVAETLHIYRSEKGVFAPRPGGIKAQLYKTDKFGAPIMDSLKEALACSVKAVCLENSNNFCGGTCMSLDAMAEVKKLASLHGVPVHLDGARLFNAAAYLGVTIERITRHVDSVMFCISKGLGAPVGSLVCGSRKFIAAVAGQAKIMGAVMRQAGVLAAPGMLALDDAYDRSARDNKNARLIAETLAAAKGKLDVDMETVQSNIIKVFVTRTGKEAPEVLAELQDWGLKAGSVNKEAFRLVLHGDLTDAEVQEASKIIAGYSRSA